MRQLLLAAAILTAFARLHGEDETHRSPVRWTAPFPDLSKPHAGFPLLENVEHFGIYRTTTAMGVYSHHSQLTHGDGFFYAAWSSHQFGEDGAGQRVLMSISKDGENWIDPIECFPPRGPVKSPHEMGRALTANGWVRIDGAFYSIAEVHDNIGFVTLDGGRIGPKREGEFRRRARKGHGRLARRVLSDGSLGPIFWLVADPPAPLPGFEPIPGADHPRFREIARKINAVLDEPLNKPNWDFLAANTQLGAMWDLSARAADGHNLCEPSTYRRPDGALVRVYRDHSPTHRLYASLSHDAGKSWTVPVATNIPDSPSRTAAGMLDDGTVFIVGNQVSEPFTDSMKPHYPRDPLTMILSSDGITFDRAFAVRGDAPKIRLKGGGKGRGYQYPAAIVVGDAIWIMYTIGKEDVGISKVPLKSLPDGK